MLKNKVVHPIRQMTTPQTAFSLFTGLTILMCFSKQPERETDGGGKSKSKLCKALPIFSHGFIYELKGSIHVFARSVLNCKMRVWGSRERLTCCFEFFGHLHGLSPRE